MPAVAETTKPAADPHHGFMPVNVTMLRHVATAPVDIYVQHDPEVPPRLYCRAGLQLNRPKLSSLAEAGVRDVFVRTSEFEDFGGHLLEAVELMAAQESIPAADRFAALQLAVAVEVEHTVRLIDCHKFVSLSGQIGSDIASYVAGSDVLPRDLFRLARHDFNTFTHVTNVASYSVILAERMGIVDRRELEQIATAAMLHDIGKRFIPAGILRKTARLAPDERDLVELHPTRGYEDLCQRSDLNDGQLMMVYQHHEWVDGNGYPVGVPGTEIHPWARMLAVVDVFEAMTGKRSYRHPISIEDALQYIIRNAGTHFDVEVAKCWVSAMKSE